MVLPMLEMTASNAPQVMHACDLNAVSQTVITCARLSCEGGQGRWIVWFTSEQGFTHHGQACHFAQLGLSENPQKRKNRMIEFSGHERAD